MGKVKYKALTNGKGGFVIVENLGWMQCILFGSRYYPISFDLKTEKECDDFVQKREATKRDKKNAGKILKEYR